MGWNNQSYAISKGMRVAIQLPSKQRLVGPNIGSFQVWLCRQRRFHCGDATFASRRFLFLLSHSICKLSYLCYHGMLRPVIYKSNHRCLNTSVDNDFARVQTELKY